MQCKTDNDIEGSVGNTCGFVGSSLTFHSFGLCMLRIIATMFRSLCIHLICVLTCSMPQAGAIVPGLTSGMYGDIVGHSDFELNLRPPEEKTQDTQAALDALMKTEDINFKASQAEYSGDKTRMLQAEKVAIEEIVASAFNPLLAKLNAL